MIEKSKCPPQQMMKVIKRNMEMMSDDILPEHNLILAIIGGAIIDLRQKAHRQAAIMFFKHKLFDIYCDLIGLDSGATRKLLVQGGFLPVALERKVKPNLTHKFLNSEVNYGPRRIGSKN